MLAVGCAGQAPPPSIAVGASSDPESQVLAHLYVAALRFYGNAAHVQEAQDPLRGLDSGDITVAPVFTGRLLHRLDPQSPARSEVQVYRTLLSSLPEGIAAGDYTISAQDEPALAVTEQAAETWAGDDVSDVLPRCPELSVGAVDGQSVPQMLGTCRLSATREFDDDAAMFAALRAGGIDAAWTTTAAPDVPEDVAVLADTTSLVRAENVVPLYRRNELTESQVLALNEIAGVLDTGSLADMRRQVAEGADAGLVAGRWLDEHPLGVGN